MPRSQDYVQSQLRSNESLVLETESTIKGLLITWLSLPGGCFIYWLIVYFPVYLQSIVSSSIRHTIMDTLDISGQDLSMSDVTGYVGDLIWGDVPGFMKGILVFILIMLFLAWLGLNLVQTWMHFQYALAITDSRVIGYAGREKMDVPYEHLVNV